MWPLGLGTLKSAVLQELIDEMSWFFPCWYKFRKAKSYFNNYWLNMVKNWPGFRDHGSLKLDVSHKWFDKLSRVIEWFLCTDSDGIVFGLTSNLLYIFDIYFVLILSIWLRIKPNNLRKIYSQISEKHQTSIFLEWVL